MIRILNSRNTCALPASATPAHRSSSRGRIIPTHNLHPANTHRKSVSEVAPVGVASATELCNTGHSRSDNVCSGSSMSSRMCRCRDVSVSRSCVMMATNPSVGTPAPEEH